MRIILNESQQENTNGVYLRHIIDSYQRTTGNRCLPQNKEFLETELHNWIKERQKLIENYTLLLEVMDIDYNNRMTAETEKGIHDTIVYDKDTTIITPYTNGFQTNIKNKIIKANIQISNQNANIPPSPIPTIDHLITQNPYEEVNINNWEYIFNDSDIYATIGVFGYIYDKDREYKITMLKKFKERLKDNYKEEHYRIEDEYGYVITKAKKYQKSVKSQ